MATSETLNESTLAFWQDVYTKAAIHSPDHVVLVANLGQWAGFWDADRFIAELGFTVQKSNSSSMNTLSEAILNYAGQTMPIAQDNEGLLAQVDGITAIIFGDGPVEWSTLRRLISTDGVVKRNLGDEDGWDVASYARDVLATRQGFISEGRDYFGDQTGEMRAAISEAGYGDLLSKSGKAKVAETVHGDKADAPVEAAPKDPDAGIWQAMETLNRVMSGERKCHKEAFFVQEMAKVADNFENFRISLESAGLVETTVKG